MDKVKTLENAISRIYDDSTLMFGGFGGIGTPPTLIQAMLDAGIRNLTLIGNDAGFPDVGIGRLVSAGRVSKLIVSHIGSNPVAGKLMSKGTMEVEFSPQGTLAERIRAGGAGLPAIVTDIGLGTIVEQGKQKIYIDDQEYLVETALTAEVGIVYAKKADRFGNLVYDKTARNFNPLVAMAGQFTIVEAEEIVEVGEIDPEEVVTPGVFVDMVIQSQGVNWTWVWQSRSES